MIDEHFNHSEHRRLGAVQRRVGQHDTNHGLKWAKAYDPSRLINLPSGWGGPARFGDMMDMHMYPGPGMFPVMEDRISVLGEYGGFGLAVAITSGGTSATGATAVLRAKKNCAKTTMR
ncbi:MAG: hypothetical protein R3F11_04145 [Verrucomicrobiales bacterium]